MVGWIDQQEVLNALVDRLGKHKGFIGLDTEFVRVSTFHPKPGLIQIAIDGDALLIDPLCGMDLMPLGHALNKEVTSVLHAAQEDYEVILSLTGQLPNRVFDTQVAYALLNEKISMSLSALAFKLLGIELSKEETRSDWTKRPLTKAQCHYAREDVVVLGDLYHILSERLAATGRTEWMQQDMDAIGTRNARVLVEGDIETQVQKFGNSWRLSPGGMSRLVHLVEWREYTARLVDTPRKFVLSDKSLYSLAISGQVGSHHQLVSDHGLTDKQAGRFEGQLKREIERASNCEDISPPPPPLSRLQKNELKDRQLKVINRAKDLGIAPEMLVRKRQIIASLDGRDWCPTGWRKEILNGIFNEIG